MDMTKEALQYIVGMDTPHMVSLNGDDYTDKNLKRMQKELRAEPVSMWTLTSLIDYIRSGVDPMKGRMLVHVVSPERVELVSCLDSDREREAVAVVRACVPDFDYGTFIDHEEFLISLQAKFLQNDDRDLLLKFAGTVENGTIMQHGDDGVTQKATVKSGIASKTDAIVPNPVRLRPYRTFSEVVQPESMFVFRMKENDRGGIRCAVFEADGGAWKYEAMENIAEFIRESLEGHEGQYTVIY